MNNKKTFGLFLSCLFLSCLSCSSSEPVEQNDNKLPQTDKEKVYILTTTDNRNEELNESFTYLSDKEISSSIKIEINENTRYQSMEGFGAAITGSSAYCLLAMKPEDRKAFLKKTFSQTEGYGCSYVRISIGCSDFSLSEYTCCDKPGIENFALTQEETDYIIPVLKEILEINPDLRIIGSPWTAPLWMKDYSNYPVYNNRTFTAGELKKECYDDYAEYFVRWIQEFNKAEINITAITIQNEPLNNKNSASMVMKWDTQRDFIKVLGPKMRIAALNTKIYAYDHNYNYDNMDTQSGYPCNIYNDNDASQYITGAAYHDYGGNRSELLKINQFAPNKELIFTESSIGTWNNGHKLESTLINNMENIGIGTINNYCRAVMIWNLMLATDFENNKPVDKGGTPNRPGGCQTCYGAVDLDIADLKTIYPNSHYFMICHLSSVVKPDAVRIDAKGDAPDISYSAFKNSDGSYAIVAINKSDSTKSISVNTPNDKGESRFLNTTLQPRSVVSLSWK